MLFRYALTIIGVLGAIFTVAWVPIICMVFLSIRYPAWEVLALGVLEDFMWLPSGESLSIPLFTIAAFILVWGLEPLRKELILS